MGLVNSPQPVHSLRSLRLCVGELGAGGEELVVALFGAKMEGFRSKSRGERLILADVGAADRILHEFACLAGA